MNRTLKATLLLSLSMASIYAFCSPSTGERKVWAMEKYCAGGYKNRKNFDADFRLMVQEKSVPADFKEFMRNPGNSDLVCNEMGNYIENSVFGADTSYNGESVLALHNRLGSSFKIFSTIRFPDGKTDIRMHETRDYKTAKCVFSKTEGNTSVFPSTIEAYAVDGIRSVATEVQGVKGFSITLPVNKAPLASLAVWIPGETASIEQLRKVLESCKVFLSLENSFVPSDREASASGLIR